MNALRLASCLSLLTATALTAQGAPVRPPTPPTSSPAPMTPMTPLQPRVIAPPSAPGVYTINPDYSLDVRTSISNAFSTLNNSYTVLNELNVNNAMIYDQLSSTSHLYSDAFSGPRYSSDPADSLYKNARDLLNRGDYRRAAALFKELPQKFSSSAYIQDAMYYQAFALYRIGEKPELQEALSVLETQQTKFPPPADRASTSKSSASANTVWAGFSSNGRGNDSRQLAARIAGALSKLGMENDAAVKRALASAPNSCDSEDQSVKSEALSALMQNNPEEARSQASRILARRDPCSVLLRSSAVFIIGNKRDDASASTLIGVLKSDPSSSVRSEAAGWLGRIPGDAAFNALGEAARSDTSASVQRAAVGALATSTDPRGRTAMRGLVEKEDATESLRVSALDAMVNNVSADEATWLRGLYARTNNARVKDRIISALGRIGGDANNQWLMALVKDESTPLDTRTSALRRAGKSMDIATLGKTYDASSQRPVRDAIIDLLSERKEPEAVDKLIDIVRRSTDPSVRSHAISVLSRSKDPRAQKLLLDLIDKQ